MDFLTKLLNFFPFSKKFADTQYFFALNIGRKKLEAAVWGVEGKKLSIVNLAEATYHGEEDLDEAANISLDEALAEFEIEEPTQILFGVPQNWLIDDDLKEEYLKLLRKLVKELELSPMAYVATSHAVSHLLQKQQGIPTTAILINLSNPLTITLVKAGKVISEKTIKRTDSLAEDIEKGLVQFSDVEVLPSKILLFGALGDEEKEDKIKDELLSYPWMQNLPFLHLPRVEILPKPTALIAIALAGATETNPDVNFSEKQMVELEDSLALTKRSYTHSADKLLEESKETSSLAKAGFITGDIEQESSEDIAEEEYPLTAAPKGEVDKYQPDEQYIQSNFVKLKNVFSSIPIKFPKFGLILPIIVIAFLVAAYILLPKAKVTIFVDPKVLEKDALVVVDPQISDVDEQNSKIPGQIVETTLTTTEKGVTTGKKKIGDKAKGNVVVYNKTDSQKTFSQGAILIGEDNLRFSLDSTVNIASQSAVEGGISFGKATAQVTAEQIGPESNLPAGKELTISNQQQSEYSAKVDSAFSGGTSKDVTVVTSEDQKKLLAQALANLRIQAQQDLQSKLSEGTKVLEETLVEKITKQTYSKNVNDQAQEFSLTLSAKFTGTAYDDKDLKTMIAKLVETNIPEGFMLNLAETETEADVAKVEKDGKLVFNSKFKAKLIPKFDTQKIISDIKGKTPFEVASIVKNLENVISSEIIINPALPGPLQRLPFLPQNISVDITTK